MMVVFISQCEKKALSRTRRVLDTFANRIGDNTWQTVITEEGLQACKKLLKKTASKSTAVSCHWIRSRHRNELMWIVGNRNKFNAEGIVPVNFTRKKLSQSQWENDWHYLPLIKALVAMAALLHDWGKASVLFQKKLRIFTGKGDPLRHEWVSCLLFNALIQLSGNYQSDEDWLNLLINQNWHEQDLKKILISHISNSEDFKALDKLPPLAQLVSLLIVSHHRLPNIINDDKAKYYKETPRHNLTTLLKSIDVTWGYQNKFDETDYQHRLKQCVEFEHGLLKQSQKWSKQIKKWASRLLQEKTTALKSLEDGSWRVVLHHSRLCLMLGDHYYSSCGHDENWNNITPLIANTIQNTTQPKQQLDEHLVKVSYHALQASQSLSRLTEEMEQACDIRQLKKKSPQGFEWQDMAVSIIKEFKKQKQYNNNTGWFLVNMASTGKGKTIANAKIMQALSENGDSLRYILALGLRTLTLQTGDVYRQQIGINAEDLAILIGSRAVQELHDQAKKDHKETASIEDIGSESFESLLNDEVLYEDMPQADFLNVLFPEKREEKNKAFLYKPVLVCTIDHIMAATETTRGGKYILPCLRLLSSDLVIDEVDDFNGQDLVAIARLVHLAGMLGRKVMISSATIPPDLAEGLFNSYQKGWQLYCAFKQQSNQNIAAMWVDEFKTKIECIPKQNTNHINEDYQKHHKNFVQIRVKKLLKQIIKHKAYIVSCEHLLQQKKQNNSDTEYNIKLNEKYFAIIQQQIKQLHSQHYNIDPRTGKHVSFGVVRIANISPCVALARFLLNADWPDDIAPRIMAYHSRQVLLLRSEQEKHLDSVLTQKEKTGEIPKAFQNSIIRQHLDQTGANNVIFILVATPIEEVGRDHDFDWAVIEPSSYRSIIQLAGRILRHRQLQQDITTANIALMQYNLKGLHQDKVAYCRPGYEMDTGNKKFLLTTKDLQKLIDKEDLIHGINAIPRIQKKQPLQPNSKLVDLEHDVIHYELTDYEAKGPASLNGWLNEVWYLTALPQHFNAFRRSSPEIKLFAIPENKNITFKEKDDFGAYISRYSRYNIELLILSEQEQKYLWLYRDYATILDKISYNIDSVKDKDIDSIDTKNQRENLARWYGEIMFPYYGYGYQFIYSNQFGLVEK